MFHTFTGLKNDIFEFKKLKLLAAAVEEVEEEMILFLK